MKYATPTKTPHGALFQVSEILLVHDCGPDHSAKTLRELSERHMIVRPVWLTRNYGQHAATLAGMASSTGTWVVTLDEDGQQNPRDIGAMLDTAIEQKLHLVYARPTNPPPHGMIRNFCSALSKRIASLLVGNAHIRRFNSFRLVDGEIARSLAAYSGSGVYLDIALLWMTERIGSCDVVLRDEANRTSGYSFVRLLKHFWQLVLTSGTRPLRLITLMGIGSLFLAVCIALYAVYAKFWLLVPVRGWASILIVVSFFSGAILMSLGVIAEYMAITMGIAMGRPPYVVASKPTERP